MFDVSPPGTAGIGIGGQRKLETHGLLELSSKPGRELALERLALQPHHAKLEIRREAADEVRPIHREHRTARRPTADVIVPVAYLELTA